MKKVNRQELRGKPLEVDCKCASTDYEIVNNKIKYTYCLGWVDKRNDEIIDRCKNCKAFVDNVSTMIDKLKGGE